MAEKSLESLLEKYNEVVEVANRGHKGSYKPQKLITTKALIRGTPIIYFSGYFLCSNCGEKVSCVFERNLRKDNTYKIILQDKMLDGHRLLCEKCEAKELKIWIKRISNFIKDSKERVLHQKEVKEKIEEVKQIKEEYNLVDSDLRP